MPTNQKAMTLHHSKTMKFIHCLLRGLVVVGPIASSFVIPSSKIRRCTRPRHDVLRAPPPSSIIGIISSPSHERTRDASLHMMKLPTSVLANRAVLHADPSFVLSSILLLSTFGITLERKTLIGKALSAPLATMALALTVANLGIVPFSSPVCKSHRMILL